jgi:GT2 family glycosyltransferase
MKIAAVVITYNDDYKFNEWVAHHQVYKNGIDLHIIVDNASQSDYVDRLQSSFPDSKIIRRKTNGGCTNAYNDGIRYALKDPDVGALMLIGNDIRMEADDVRNLARFLVSDPEYGMVSPVLLAKDSQVIDDYGCEISPFLSMQPHDLGCNIDEVKVAERTVSAVTGGMNMASRKFYEVVGMQDARLFMYSDEVDMAFRARNAGFKMGVTKNIKAWHQHINPPGNGSQRHPFSAYLIGRNKVYIADKHFGYKKKVAVFGYYCLKGFLSILKSVRSNDRNLRKTGQWLMWGTINGLFGNMKHNRFSQPTG